MADVSLKRLLKLLRQHFDDLISGELTEDDREKLLYASMLGGVVISQTKTTAVHAMGYSLTYFKISTTAEQTDYCSVSLQSILKE